VSRSNAAAQMARADTESESELRLLPVASELHRARAFAEAAAERFGLGPRERHAFKLAASEAVANAIEHGRACSDGTIHLWVCERPRRLTLGVRDAGRFIPKTAGDDPLRDRGRGFAMMSALVDVVALSRVDGHTQVELSKHRGLVLLHKREA
jgi:anti-sigma regulatory factor (Ser/Thr protein kinase)